MDHHTWLHFIFNWIDLFMITVFLCVDSHSHYWFCIIHHLLNKWVKIMGECLQWFLPIYMGEMVIHKCLRLMYTFQELWIASKDLFMKTASPWLCIYWFLSQTAQHCHYLHSQLSSILSIAFKKYRENTYYVPSIVLSVEYSGKWNKYRPWLHSAYG
jgi:hypothetical protein